MHSACWMRRSSLFLSICTAQTQVLCGWCSPYGKVNFISVLLENKQTINQQHEKKKGKTRGMKRNASMPVIWVCMSFIVEDNDG